MEEEQIKRELREEKILFKDTLKWVILSAFIGLVVGSIISYFIKLVSFGEEAVQENIKYYYLFLPLIFPLCAFIVEKLAPDAEGHGTEKAIEAIHKENGKMNIKIIPVKLITTFLTIIFGGSVGQEGPATQIGAGIASYFSKILKMNDDDRRIFVVCGISAGFVGVFGAPVGAAIFASEVLFIGRISYLALLPSLIASYVSYNVGRFLKTKPLIAYVIDLKQYNPGFMFVKMIIFGIYIGLLALFFIKLVNFIEEKFKNMKANYFVKGIIGGIIIILLVFITKSTEFLGIGEGVIASTVGGRKISFSAPFVKMISSAVTLSAGGNGGMLTPMLYVGSSLGNVWAQIINGNFIFYSAVGMVAFLACCSNTPLAGIVIGMEFFGMEIGTYVAIVCVISYLIVGHRSIYPTQLLIQPKVNDFISEKKCAIKEKKIRLKNKNVSIKKLNNNKEDNIKA